MAIVKIFLVDPPTDDHDQLDRALREPDHPLHTQAELWSDRCFRPVYDPRLTYRLAITYAEDGDTVALLDRAFERFNIGDDRVAQEYRRTGNRSLSVGDIVVVDEAAHLCARFGWDPIPGFEVPELAETAG